MDMKKLSRKLIASILSMAFAVVALGTTTFAWFTANSTATASLNVNVQAGTDGILLSTDGISYSPDVTIETGDLRLQPVSYDYTKSSATVLTDFYKLNGGNLTGITSNANTSATKRAEFTNAGILQFDLYVNTSAASTASVPKGVYFTADGNTVATREDSVKSYTLLNGFTYDTNQTFLEGTKVKVSAANALRGMIDVYEDHLVRSSVIVTSKADGVSTINFGDAIKNPTFFGFSDANETFATATSAATTTDDTHYNFGQGLELTNAANSYLKVASKNPFGTTGSEVTAKVPEAGVTFANGFGSLKTRVLTTGTQADCVTKVTFTLWLEGYDADCFDAILGQSMDINLSFATDRSDATDKPAE